MANSDMNRVTMDIAFHPGETLNEKLQEMGMSVHDFAELSKVPECMVQDIINCDVSVSSEVAIAFEQVTKIPARMWINMQHSYDDYFLAKKRSTYLDRLLHLTRSKVAIL